jgi:uncharacterized membrane protein
MSQEETKRDDEFRDTASETPREIPVENEGAQTNTQTNTEASPEQGQAQPQHPPRDDAGRPIGETPMQRTTQAAREQAGAAADAFRRGEFMQDAAVDGAANSDDRLIALLSYVTQVFIPVIMPIIVLLSESSKQRPFQRYHAVQSLALTLLFVLIAVAAGIGAMIIQIIPVVGQLVALLLFCLSPIAYLMAVIAMFYYGYQAYQGKRFAIPGLTTFLRDQGWLA